MNTEERRVINELKKNPKPWLEIKRLCEADKAILRNLSSAKIAQAIGAPSKDRDVRKYLLTPMYKTKAYISDKINNAQDNLSKELLDLLLKNRDEHFSYEELSERFDRSPSSIKVAIQSLADNGHHVREQVNEDSNKVTLPSGGIRPQELVKIDFRGDEVLFGVVSDTHLGSRYCALDMLNSAYDLFEKEGVKSVLNCGDLTEGPGNRGYQGHVNDTLEECQTWRGLETYVSANYPKRKNIHTYAISSSKSHDGWEWNASGRCPTADVCNGRIGANPLPPRDDMTWLGHDCADISFGNVLVRLLHPDGGSSYASSYKAQKFIEAMPGGTKPHMLLIGHYHSYCAVRARNVEGVCVPGMQWPTPLFIRYAKEPCVGALLVSARVDAEGSLRSVRIEDLIHYHADNKMQEKLVANKR